jgi:hypothetical protein
MFIKSFATLSTAVVPGVTTSLVNYWPVKNGVMVDLVGLVNTSSAGSPQFTPDRFGNVNDAILVNSSTSHAKRSCKVEFAKRCLFLE